MKFSIDDGFDFQLVEEKLEREIISLLDKYNFVKEGCWVEGEQDDVYGIDFSENVDGLAKLQMQRNKLNREISSLKKKSLKN